MVDGLSRRGFLRRAGGVGAGVVVYGVSAIRDGSENDSDKGVNRDLGPLKKLLKPEYRTADRVEEYVKEKLIDGFKKLERSDGLTYEQMARLCHSEDFIEVDDYVKYHRGVLDKNGNVPMHRMVVNRLCYFLGVRHDGDHKFPFITPISESNLSEVSKELGGGGVILSLENALRWRNGFLS